MRFLSQDIYGANCRKLKYLIVRAEVHEIRGIRIATRAQWEMKNWGGWSVSQQRNPPGEGRARGLGIDPAETQDGDPGGLQRSKSLELPYSWSSLITGYQNINTKTLFFSKYVSESLFPVPGWQNVGFRQSYAPDSSSPLKRFLKIQKISPELSQSLVLIQVLICQSTNLIIHFICRVKTLFFPLQWALC